MESYRSKIKKKYDTHLKHRIQSQYKYKKIHEIIEVKEQMKANFLSTFFTLTSKWLNSISSNTPFQIYIDIDMHIYIMAYKSYIQNQKNGFSIGLF